MDHGIPLQQGNSMQHNLAPRHQFWSDKLQEAEQFDGSLAEFARQHNIPAKKLYQWRSTLRSKITNVTQETRFTRVVTNNSGGVAALTIVLPNAKLQFNSLPDSQWLAELLSNGSRSS